MNPFSKKYALKIKVPKTIEIVYSPDKVTFRGSSQDIQVFSEQFRGLAQLSDGQLCKLDKLTLKVFDSITLYHHKENWIELPAWAWNIMASKFLEVTDGFENSPFYFNRCGCTYKIPLDIGVEVIG